MKENQIIFISIVILFVLVLESLRRVNKLREKHNGLVDTSKYNHDNLANNITGQLKIINSVTRRLDDGVTHLFKKSDRLLNFLGLEDVTIAEEKVIRKVKKGRK